MKPTTEDVSAHAWSVRMIKGFRFGTGQFRRSSNVKENP